jgi:hypothetical protein
MTAPNPSIAVAVDPTNPGQFFACCGLLELADRLWPQTDARPAAEGWFSESGREFHVACGGTLRELLDALVAARLEPLDPDDGATSPVRLPLPRPVVLDWWHDTRSGGSDFKTWAGRQQVVVIARAMQAAIVRAAERGTQLLNYGELLPDPEQPQKTVAPLYFDARRANWATNLDVGFSLDVQGIAAPTHPAVEFLCLVGLQRFRPAPAGNGYAYRLWTGPNPPATAAAFASGAVVVPGDRGFQFRLLYRTKYLKGFLPAQPTPGG